MSITAYCRECKIHGFKNLYQIRVPDSPVDGVLQSIVHVNHSEHKHNSNSLPSSSAQSSSSQSSLSQ